MADLIALAPEPTGVPVSVRVPTSQHAPGVFANPAILAGDLAQLARTCLDLEVETYPKPGLVSHIDTGSHRDMNAAVLHASAACLQPGFEAFVRAGQAQADMACLREIGLAAEARMLEHTGGVNTHRGAIFGMGLLLAAAGLRQTLGSDRPLGELVAQRWGHDIRFGPTPTASHGVLAQQRYGASGARGQAASGFPVIYEHGLPALRAGLALAQGNRHNARVHVCFALIASLEDTNLLHRGGVDGLRFAQMAARKFMRTGGIADSQWRERAIMVHRDFVARWLSPGGSADLLGMTLLVHALEPASSRVRHLVYTRAAGVDPC